MKSLRGGARNIGTALQFVSLKMHVHTGHAKLGSLVNKLTSTCTSGHSATAYLRDCSTTNTSSVEVSLTTEPSVNRPQCQYKEALVHLLFTSKVLISLIPEILSMFDAGVNFLNCVRGFLTSSIFFFHSVRSSRSRCWSGLNVTSTLSICVSNNFENSLGCGGLANVVTANGLRSFCSIKPLERNSSHSLTHHHSFPAALRGETVM